MLGRTNPDEIAIDIEALERVSLLSSPRSTHGYSTFTPEQPQSPFFRLPQELRFMILDLLSGDDLFNALPYTNRSFRNLLTDYLNQHPRGKTLRLEWQITSRIRFFSQRKEEVRRQISDKIPDCLGLPILIALGGTCMVLSLAGIYPLVKTDSHALKIVIGIVIAAALLVALAAFIRAGIKIAKTCHREGRQEALQREFAELGFKITDEKIKLRLLS